MIKPKHELGNGNLTGVLLLSLFDGKLDTTIHTVVHFSSKLAQKATVPQRTACTI